MDETCRIRKKAQFDRVFRTGQNRHTAHLRVVVAAAPDGIGRLGLVVSRRVGKAYARNRVKRRIREYYRRHRGALQGPVEIVVVAKPGAAEIQTRALWQELGRALREWLPTPSSAC